MTASPISTYFERREYSVPIPKRMTTLPWDPRTRHLVPWFVAQLDDGSFDFRLIGRETMPGSKGDYPKSETALRYNKCWLCGQWLGGGDKWFAIGPMCAINRVSSEPPSHYECVTFAVQTCPFMVHPRAVRRDANMPDEARPPGGNMIERNPGVTLLWHTRKMRPFDDGRGGQLIDVGEPLAWEWWAEGRRATRAEVVASITSGMPELRSKCDLESTPIRRKRAHASVNWKYEHVMQTYLPNE